MNGLFGERGLMDTIRARRAFPPAARGELGLVRPGEILVTSKGVK